jgi:preprotein translocase subunit SecA
MARREAVLAGEDDGRLWPEEGSSYDAAVSAVGETAVREAERLVTLNAIDRAWRSHLAFSADLREGIHLVTLGGMEPLAHYTTAMVGAYTALVDALDRDVRAAFRRMRARGSHVDVIDQEVKRPSSTWTYVVNDDPFRNHVSRLLMGPGNVTLAVYAAAVLAPLFVLWGVIEWLRRRTRR